MHHVSMIRTKTAQVLKQYVDTKPLFQDRVWRFSYNADLTSVDTSVMSSGTKFTG